MFVVVLVVVGSGHVHAHVLQMCCLCRYPCLTRCCLETVTHDHEHWGRQKPGRVSEQNYANRVFAWLRSNPKLYEPMPPKRGKIYCCLATSES